MSAKKNLHQKLLDITHEIGTIEKTGRNKFQNYNFIEQAAVVSALRPLLHKHKVMIIPETRSRSIERYTTAKGGIGVHSNVVSTFTLVNAEDPADLIVCEWDAGEAMDTSDKATNKALTASQKGFYMKLFNISDKDDVEHSEPDPPVKKVEMTDLQKTKLDIVKEFNKQGLNTPEVQQNYIETVLGKKSIDNKDEADSVLQELEAENAGD